MYSQFKVINVQQLFFPFYFDLYAFVDMYWGTVLFFPFSNSPPPLPMAQPLSMTNICHF